MPSASDTPLRPASSGHGVVRPSPRGTRRDGAVTRSGANRGLTAVAERQAQGGRGCPGSHPEHGDTPMPPNLSNHEKKV